MGTFLLGESGTCFTSLFQKTKSCIVALKNGMFQNYVKTLIKHKIQHDLYFTVILFSNYCLEISASHELQLCKQN